MKLVSDKNTLNPKDRDVALERRELWKDAALTALGQKDKDSQAAATEADGLLKAFDERFVSDE